MKSAGSYAGSDIDVAIEIANRLGMKPFLKPYLDSSNCADRQMKNIIRNSISDALTGLYNRHAFETDTNELREKLCEDLIVFSFDSNGLKKINNTYGHSAVDKLLRLAGICIDYPFGKYGKVYRYGGDKFIALIYVDSRKINLILDNFKKNCGRKQGI